MTTNDKHIKNVKTPNVVQPNANSIQQMSINVQTIENMYKQCNTHIKQITKTSTNAKT